MKTLNDFDFKNKKIIRDFNVPLDENFNVTDATNWKQQNHNRLF
jgi:phosphoglycerate kinase